MEPGGTPGAREVFERTQQDILAGRFEDYADAFAEDAVFELPFAPEGVPRRLEGGERIRQFLLGARADAGTTRRWTVENRTVHETTDPEVIVTEFEVHVDDPQMGAPYSFANLQVWRVRDGRILSLRDYWSPLDRPELRRLVAR